MNILKYVRNKILITDLVDDMENKPFCFNIEDFFCKNWSIPSLNLLSRDTFAKYN